ncbi:MAG: PAS domain-containing sensor histidine kinase [Candidatus Nitrospinota bacterium M3_3B_026]
MAELSVLLLSIILQLLAALFALRLIWVTGSRVAWSLIALAVTLMAARRGITLLRVLSGDISYPPDLYAELVALAISAVMLLGIAWIAPLFNDIKRYGEKLRESEERYRRLVENSPDAIAITAGGKIVYANPALVEILGAGTAERVLGRPMIDFVDFESRQPLMERLEKTYAEGGKQPLTDLEMLRLDGSIMSVEAVCAPFVYEGGPAVVTIMRDIMERKAMEERLRRTLIERDIVLDNAVVGIILLKDRKVVWANQKARLLFGLPDSERAEGLSAQVAHISPESFEKVGAEAYPRLERGDTYDTEIKLKRFDGEVFWARLFGKAVEPSDLSRGSIWIVDDITQRKRAEEERDRLMTAVEQAAETVMIADSEGVIQYVNPAFEKVTGYSREEALGRNPRMLKSGRQDVHFYRQMWDTIKGGRTWTGYMTNRRKDGSFYEEENTISPVFDSQGEIINFVAIKRDVSREAMLAHAKDYFTAVTSHELRTPLSKLELVRMMLDGVEAAPGEKDKLEEIRSLLKESSFGLDRIIYATSLISDLTVSAARDRFQSVDYYFDLLYCVESARAAIDKEGREVSIALGVEGDAREAKILSDRRLFRSAVDEAVSNAVRYSPRGGVVRVSAVLEGGSVVIRIKDEGEGIPADKRGQVLEPYFSLEDPLHHSTGQSRVVGGGMGLGLTIIRLIMESHDGKFEMDSGGPGKGTEVILGFPLGRGL